MTTPFLGLPLVASQQSQPEVTHNEAITLLSAMLAGVEEIGRNTPPVSPSAGDTYVLGASPTRTWAGHANHVATYTTGGWRFLPGRDDSGTIITMGADQEGLRVWLKGAGVSPPTDGYYRWDGSAWTEVTIPSVASAYYGQLTCTNNTVATAMTAAVDSTLNTASDYVKVSAEWDTTPHGLQYRVTQGADSLTIQVAGVYRIEMWATASSNTPNTNLGFKHSVNGTLLTGRRPWASCGAADNKVEVSAYGFATLAVGDVVSQYWASDKSANVTLSDSVFGVTLLREV